MNDCCTGDNCKNCTLRKVHKDILLDTEAERLNKNRVELKYKKGETICKQGSFASSIICIRSGLVKIYKENDSSTSTLALKKKGDIIGLQSLYSNGFYHFSAEALSDTQVCLIDMVEFKELIIDNVSFAKEMIRYINQDVINMFDQLFSFSTKHIHGRLAELLIHLNEEIYQSNPFELTLSKTDVAQILGTSKESVSRLFKELKLDGIIEESDHIVKILDNKRLNRISNTG